MIYMNTSFLSGKYEDFLKFLSFLVWKDYIFLTLMLQSFHFRSLKIKIKEIVSHLLIGIHAVRFVDSSSVAYYST